jgi:transcriptional regulator with XRE-family HTH domain
MVTTTLGDKIRVLRKEKGLTLEQLAEKTESSKGYIWELENRETKKPSAEKLQKIAEELGVTTEFLLDEGRANPDDAVMQQAFFRKFDKLDDDDQKKIMQIVDTWSSKK